MANRGTQEITHIDQRMILSQDAVYIRPHSNHREELEDHGVPGIYSMTVDMRNEIRGGIGKLLDEIRAMR